MIKFILAVVVFVFNSAAHGAVQTDTHTYIVGEKSDQVLAINRSSGAEQKITVGRQPRSMVIHGDVGYVLNMSSKTISVIDLQANSVTQSIAVGEWPLSMVIHGDLGYVANMLSNTISVIDLQANTVTQSIAVGRSPRSMVIHGDLGYVVNGSSHNLSVIDLQANTVTQSIPVGEGPQSMIIHGDLGYVVNAYSKNVSVIDLKTNTVTQSITVGWHPRSIVIHGNLGYVMNSLSNTISVIDLQTNTVTQSIAVGNHPQSMIIHGDLGYVVNVYSKNVSVIDLKTNTVVRSYLNPENWNIDFSDTHVYLGLEKLGPLYPTLDSLQRMKEQKRLDEFRVMNPDVFDVGEVKPRAYPKQETDLDILPPYLLAQEIFWDLKSGKPIIDPLDILANLTTMMYPQKFLQTEAGRWLRSRLHMAFFQEVWLNQTEKAQTMLKYFIQLEDPVISEIAPYANLNKKKVQVSGQNKKAKKSDGMSSLSSDYNNYIENENAMQEDHPSTSSNSTSK